MSIRFDDIEIYPEKIAPFLMQSLALNDFPDIDWGLETVWHFSTDTLRTIFNHNMSDFISCAHKTADGFPTSFYGSALKGRHWEMERPIVMVGGNTTECWIATHLMRTTSSDGRVRRWQWELRSASPDRPLSFPLSLQPPVPSSVHLSTILRAGV